MTNIIDIYYELNEDIIDNYDMNQRNYYNLQNLYKLKENNEILIKDLTSLINNDNISEIYKYSLNHFYNVNGERYLGEMKNGYKEGKGILYYDKDDIHKRKKYEGEFINDKREGNGKIFWNDGAI